jgi:predicted Mrr-cat superfamily restriction endonuclease
MKHKLKSSKVKTLQEYKTLVRTISGDVWKKLADLQVGDKILHIKKDKIGITKLLRII